MRELYEDVRMSMPTLMDEDGMPTAPTDAIFLTILGMYLRGGRHRLASGVGSCKRA